MIKLSKNEYHIVRELFEEIEELHLYATSVLEGNSDGIVITDSKTTPIVAIIQTIGGEGDIYFGGEPGNLQFNKELNKYFIKSFADNSSIDYSCFTCYWSNPGWQDAFHGVFFGFDPILVHRTAYSIKKEMFDNNCPVPDGFEAKVITPEFYYNNELSNMELLRDWVDIEDGIHPLFREFGLGICLVDKSGNTAASWCQYDYFGGDGRAEMGINTAPEYRKKGLATAVVKLALSRLFDNGIRQVGWHYWNHNPASGKTAARAGFQKQAVHQVYHAEFNRFDNYLLQGYFYPLYYNDYFNGALSYEKAFALSEAGHEDYHLSPHLKSTGEANLSGYYYHAAALWALCGEKDRAFCNLYKAALDGYCDIEEIQGDERFKLIRYDNKWQELIKCILQ